jgi:hypothetical protein
MKQLAEVPIVSACGDTNDTRLMNLQDDIKGVIARLKSSKGGLKLRGYDNEHTVELRNGHCIKILGDFISFANLVAWELLVTNRNISKEEILEAVWNAFLEERKRLRRDRDVLSLEQPWGKDENGEPTGVLGDVIPVPTSISEMEGIGIDPRVMWLISEIAVDNKEYREKTLRWVEEVLSNSPWWN